MRIVFIRHGDPNYEEDCLTELGHKQAKIAAERLLKEGIEEIYSSPLGRARQTAQAFSEVSGIGEIKILDFMKEIRYGTEDELYNDKWNPWLGVDALVKNGIDIQSPDWREYPVFKENLATVDADKIGEEADKWLVSLGYEREGNYYRCSRKDDKEKTIALFCHGGSSTAFFSRVLNQQFPYMCAALLHYPHTTISVLKFNKNPGQLCQPIIELLNDARHLMG
ncbi:MAG: histidine phosphatase family protein [Treponema sp.]|nr:histidine phosphatase family protein [Treponema sp.]